MQVILRDKNYFITHAHTRISTFTDGKKNVNNTFLLRLFLTYDITYQFIVPVYRMSKLTHLSYKKSTKFYFLTLW